MPLVHIPRMQDSLKKKGVEYLRHVLDTLQMDPSVLAAKIKVSSTTLTRPLNNPQHRYGLSLKTLLAIQDFSGIPLPTSLLGGNGIQAMRPALRSREAPSRDLPVRGQAAGGNGDGFVMHDDLAHSYVERPWFLLGNPQAFAIYAYDSSMSPAIEHGHLVYLDPSRPCSVGDDVLIELHDGQAFLKRLVRRTATEVICRQFNPAKQRRFPAKSVKHMYLIIASLRVRS